MSVGGAASINGDSYTLRSYQTEMVEASLKQNVIVAMDTGSGKTAIAVARAEAALEAAEQDKVRLALWISCFRTLISIRAQICWLLSPTVALCRQHKTVFEKYLSRYQSRLLVGSEGVERWTDQSTWDEALLNQRIVISTEAVLLDALGHGFVKMSKITLLVFDEGTFRPLTSTHRCTKNHPSVRIMQEHYFQVPSFERPGILGLTASPEPIHLLEANLNARTSASSICEEIGHSAAVWFILACISRYLRTIRKYSQQLSNWLDSERVHLAHLLQKLSPSSQDPAAPMLHDRANHRLYSPKTERLFKLLLDEWSENFTGIIFVQQRAQVVAMAELLSSHPLLGPKFRVRGIVGESNSSLKKKNITELLEPKAQQTALADFRSGLVNLVVCTNALQEGIDIPNCHLVVCFDHPPNLVAFVQRRGRARRSQSKYVILQCEEDTKNKNWATLEKRLEEAYQDECRISAENLRLEEQEEEGNRSFRVATTGALLNLENSVPHLYHFCSTLNAGAYVDPRPQIAFHSHGLEEVMANITLPLSVDPSVRFARSSKPYLTEKTAKKDAAFEAYLSLYRAGLLNDNLLPLKTSPEEDLAMESSKSFRVGPCRFDPWPAIAEQYSTPLATMSKFLITISGGQKTLSMAMYSPEMPIPSEFYLHWNQSTQYRVSVELQGTCQFDEDEAEAARKITKKILHSAHGSRMSATHDDFLTYFLPVFYLESALQKNEWTQTSSEYYRQMLDLDRKDLGVVMLGDVKHIFQRFTAVEKEQMTNAGITSVGPNVIVSRYPKRRDFLHVVKGSDIADAYTTEIMVPTCDCRFSDLPGSVAIFSLFIPSILRRFELAMVAQELNSTLLKSVGIRNLGLVQRAITHNSACEQENYQRLEFLGDCILKLFTSTQLMVDHPNWHEGYLTTEKGRRVSNTTLDAVTRRIGLDKFIISEPFTGAKWRPLYIHEVLKLEPRPEAHRPSKILADVIESNIGAAYLDDGLDASLRAIKVFFPDDQWLRLEDAARHLNSVATGTKRMEPHLGGLEELLGYTCKSPRLLLEAMTHPSFQSHDLASTMSYPRMEFIGDAILDFLVVRRLFCHAPELGHDEMHTLRTALVNEYILGYLCMTHSVAESRHNPVVDEASGTITIEESTVGKFLWQYMRFSGEALLDAQVSAMDRLSEFSDQLKMGLQSNVYPWATLTHFAPDKFFSDIIESTIGAIFIDSCGSFSACDAFLRDLGLWELLDRLVAKQVDCVHPKSKLGELADRQKWKSGISSLEKSVEGAGWLLRLRQQLKLAKF
ncbi:P-loop containing nucleoside triphosphate hydrolase protein [Venturia nashicola]|uniref:P-loop containing nucleoside triphosphate hydrolase protein n=1 Tax=Venturia nashicola TaxID=86259 RepID=A0A4Z1PM02_9PEZI|nr:P-loop containing nucleoside triphosphate hydrolase protein [Venturia nashicola]